MVSSTLYIASSVFYIPSSSMYTVRNTLQYIVQVHFMQHDTVHKDYTVNKDYIVHKDYTVPLLPVSV